MSRNLDFLHTLKLNNRYTFKTKAYKEPRRGTLLRILVVNNFKTLLFNNVDNLPKRTELSFPIDNLVEISDLTDELRTILQSLPDNPISIINNYI
jgi:hypothetical protein